MASLEYKNRKGHTYYLQKMIGKNNKEKFVFARKIKYEPIEKIPNGFEVYEVPTTGLVLLRKKQIKIFTEDEKNILKKEIKKNKHVGDFRIEEKKQELIVYATEKKNVKSIFKGLPGIFGKGNPLLTDDKMEALQEFFDNNIDLEPLLKISVLEENPRTYIIERHYYSNDINPWMHVGISKDLKKLAKKCCKTLFTDDFFELM